MLDDGEILVRILQRSQKWFVRGCGKFDPALAYLFCPALPGSCLARFTDLLWELCTLCIKRDGPISQVVKQWNTVSKHGFESISDDAGAGEAAAEDRHV